MIDATGFFARERIRNTRWLALLVLPILSVIGPPDDRPIWIEELFEVAGIVLLVLCLVGRGWAAIYIAGRKNRELAMFGPYSIVRNPLYVFSFIGLAGIGLLSQMVTLAAVALVIFTLYYRFVIRNEEAYLSSLHGQEFARYCARVPRWLPNFRLWQDAEKLEVQPRLIFAHLRDTSLFFVAYMLFEAIQNAHEFGLFPVLATVP